LLITTWPLSGETEPGHDLHQGAFTGAVTTQQTYTLAFFHAEIDAIEQRRIAEAHLQIVNT
jgi:hypothetical protein